MALRMTEEEYLELMKGRKKNSPSAAAASPLSPETGGCLEKVSKYRNHKVEVNGLKFDSKHEASVYEELMIRVRAGELRAVMRQVPFDLPGGIRYIADFVALTQDMRIEGVYDAKSPITKQNRVYINKKKQMRALWGITIKEV